VATQTASIANSRSGPRSRDGTQLSATHDVHVKVVYKLARVLALVHDKPVTAVRQPGLYRDLPCDAHQMAEQPLAVRAQNLDSLYVFFWHDKYVNRRRGVDVGESERSVVRVKLPAGQVTADHSAEYAVLWSRQGVRRSGLEQ